MQRFGTVIKLKAECETLYRQYHAAVWPEVLQKIRECNIENYSIFLKNHLLFAYFEYHGDDIKSDLEKMASDPKTQEWWAITGRCRSRCRIATMVSGGRPWMRSFISSSA